MHPLTHAVASIPGISMGNRCEIDVRAKSFLYKSVFAAKLRFFSFYTFTFSHEKNPIL